MIRRRLFQGATALAASALLALTGCSAQGGPDAAPADGLTVFATTGYLADAVANIAPEAEIVTMVGPGGDPHTYQPSTQDIETMRAADLVLWNGLHLEAQMLEQLESLGERQLAVGEQLPEDRLLPWPEGGEHGEKLYDPHIWNDPELWRMVVDAIAVKLGEIDPDGAEGYRTNAEAYGGEIAALDAEAEELLGALPADRRVLVSGHDAFGYFGARYGLEVHATDFVSTEAQLSATELSELAELIVQKRVPVIFADNQANPQAVTSLQEAVHSRGWQLRISEAELYADTLGAEAGVDSYLGVFRHNVETVAGQLGGEAAS